MTCESLQQKPYNCQFNEYNDYCMHMHSHRNSCFLSGTKILKLMESSIFIKKLIRIWFHTTWTQLELTCCQVQMRDRYLPTWKLSWKKPETTLSLYTISSLSLKTSFSQCSKQQLLKLKFSDLVKRVCQHEHQLLIKERLFKYNFSIKCACWIWGLKEWWRRSLRNLIQRQRKDNVLFQGDNAIRPMVKQLVYGHKGLKGSQIK